MPVHVETQGPVTIVTIDRPDRRNAVDRPTADALASAFGEFEENPEALVAVLCGSGGNFCAGADLQAIASEDGNRLSASGNGPMGPSRMSLSKPVIAAVSGYAVAGGLELAIWCDMRVVEEDATFGVYCRRWGVPLIDGGTVRLPRLVGQGRAMDMILTGRSVAADEALRMGLADRVVPAGTAREAATELALQIARNPQGCLRADRRSALEQWSLPEAEAIHREFAGGVEVVRSGETLAGATRFRDGAGRHGEGSDGL